MEKKQLERYICPYCNNIIDKDITICPTCSKKLNWSKNNILTEKEYLERIYSRKQKESNKYEENIFNNDEQQSVINTYMNISDFIFFISIILGIILSLSGLITLIIGKIELLYFINYLIISSLIIGIGYLLKVTILWRAYLLKNTNDIRKMLSEKSK